MNDIIKINLFIFALFAHYLSFGMMVGRNPQPIHRARFQDHIKQARFSEERTRAFNRMREDLRKEKEDLKRLEHSCFKGESLSFQNEFFSSDYKNLPRRQLDIYSRILGPDSNELINQSFGVFPYHAQYRKDCIKMLESFGSYVQEKIVYDAVLLGTLSASSSSDAVQLALLGVHNKNSLLQLTNALSDMNDAFLINDYPAMIYIYKRMKINGVL